MTAVMESFSSSLSDRRPLPQLRLSLVPSDPCHFQLSKKKQFLSAHLCTRCHTVRLSLLLKHTSSSLTGSFHCLLYVALVCLKSAWMFLSRGGCYSHYLVMKSSVDGHITYLSCPLCLCD